MGHVAPLSPLLKLVSIIGLWPKWDVSRRSPIGTLVLLVLCRVVCYAAVTAGSVFGSVITIIESAVASTSTVELTWFLDVVVSLSNIALLLMSIRYRKTFAALLDSLEKLKVSSQHKQIAKYRRISMIWLLDPLLLVGVYVTTSAGFYMNMTSRTSPDVALASLIIGSSAFIYPFTIKVTFAAICFLLGEEYKVVNEELESLLNIRDRGSARQLYIGEDLENLRQYHQQLCDVTSMLRNIFSPMFSITVPCDLIVFAISVFYVVVADNLALRIFITTRMVESSGHLFLIFFAADYVRNHASGPARIIQRGSVHRLDIKEQLQVVLFAKKDFEFCSNVDAGGFFVVSRNLIPVIAGSMITYLTILYQFHYSEGETKKSITNG